MSNASWVTAAVAAAGALGVVAYTRSRPEDSGVRASTLRGPPRCAHYSILPTICDVN
jgi:hypothetical protein